MLVRGVWPSRPSFESYTADFDELRSEMLRLLDAVGPAGAADAGVFPPLNVSQDDDTVFVRAEVPGIKAEDLEISVVRNRLLLAGRREIPREHERVSYHRKERPEGAFRRAVALPAEVDPEQVEARYTDGILTLSLAKAEQAKPRQIVVKT
jgi:HSP20 family protein